MLKGDRKTGRTNNEYWSPNLLMMKGEEDRENKRGVLVT